MKVPSVLSLLIAASVSLAASAAVAMPSSASSSLREAALAQIQIAQHRKHVRQHHRAAPAEESYGYFGTYSPYGGKGTDEWSHWSPSHHPGWPCIASGGSDGSETSAYPAWEMKPQCQ